MALTRAADDRWWSRFSRRRATRLPRARASSQHSKPASKVPGCAGPVVDGAYRDQPLIATPGTPGASLPAGCRQCHPGRQRVGSPSSVVATSRRRPESTHTSTAVPSRRASRASKCLSRSVGATAVHLEPARRLRSIRPPERGIPDFEAQVNAVCQGLFCARAPVSRRFAGPGRGAGRRRACLCRGYQLSTALWH